MYLFLIVEMTLGVWLRLMNVMFRILFITLLRSSQAQEDDDQSQGRQEEDKEGAQGQLQQQERLL